YGESRFPAPGKLTVPAIWLADELTPSQFLERDKTLLKGRLRSGGGTTSHTVILARSFNIPTLVGVEMAALQPWVGQPVYICLLYTSDAADDTKAQGGCRRRLEKKKG
ncbi:PEP-utilizing enzyme, partial [Raoultella ornithinolytica]|uniref:PEP-utilizing enzyme n=1 Tax=Raoultella ornithinolytica TaxID=54291 RepID=UPI002228624A